MKTSNVFNINAIVFVALGIAFALYGPMVLAFMQVPEMGIDAAAYWQVAAFARMFGAALFGLGFLIWSLARAGEAMGGALRASLLRSLLLGNLALTFVAITEQVSIWGVPIGWAISAVFAAFTLLYAWLIFSGRA